MNAILKAMFWEMMPGIPEMDLNINKPAKKYFDKELKLRG
jgi:hypothetical protein